MEQQPFCAGIAIRSENFGQIIMNRVTCRDFTRAANIQKNTSLFEDHQKFRLKMLEILRSACPDLENGERLAVAFLNLADSFNNTKAIGIPTEYTMRFSEKYKAMQISKGEAWKDGSNCDNRPLYLNTRILQHHAFRECLLHPLMVALLAFDIGGPVNAANTACTHTWKLPDRSTSTSQPQNVYVEGNDVLHDHRVTLVWEEYEEKLKSLSGDHHVFSGDIEPQSLSIIPSIDGDIDAPLTIMYHSKHAALCYTSQRPDAIRHSISLDFHIHTTPDDILELIAHPDPDYKPTNIENVTLTSLVTNFPIVDYGNHFYRMLFSPTSLKAIIHKLSTISIPGANYSSATQSESHKNSIKAYKTEYGLGLSPALQNVEDVCLLGTHYPAASYFKAVCKKACLDIHLPIGCDLLHDIDVDSNIQLSHKFLRSLPPDLVSRRLGKYMSTLMLPKTKDSLLPTEHLYNMAKKIETRSLELVSAGFVDTFGLLPSIPSFVAAFGKAINGLKESKVVPKLWVDDLDLQIVRTRSLFLFWCADWLVTYYDNTQEGPFMLGRVSDQHISSMKWEMSRIAEMLLTDWLAWGLFVDGLPKGGFWVAR